MGTLRGKGAVGALEPAAGGGATELCHAELAPLIVPRAYGTWLSNVSFVGHAPGLPYGGSSPRTCVRCYAKFAYLRVQVRKILRTSHTSRARPQEKRHGRVDYLLP